MANVAVIGYGSQGRSAYEYWSALGNTVTICDQNTDVTLPDGVKSQLGPGYLDNLAVFDLIVRSPAVHPQDILEANSKSPTLTDKITSNTNEFFRVCTAPIIGVTGTKGKGTTSTLITRILETAGHTVHLGGNIGIPPLDMLKKGIQESDIVILELANFQLIDLHYSPHIAVCLMITDEHLNWHHVMYEYIHAKQQIFAHQKPDDIAIYNANNVYTTEIVTSSPAHTKISYDVPDQGAAPQFTDGAYVDDKRIMMRGHHVCNVDDMRLPGRHNLQNVCAAIAATWDIVKGDTHVIKKAIKDFQGLPHHLENLGTYRGVTYIDDSFGTNPATAKVAIEAFPQPKVLILGGSDKNNDFSELIKTISSSDIRHIIAIGEMGPQIVSQLRSIEGGDKIPYTLIDTSGTMADIIAAASKVAQKNDVVLLSTACASFDMFENYKDRGIQFQTEFKRLQQARA